MFFLKLNILCFLIKKMLKNINFLAYLMLFFTFKAKIIFMRKLLICFLGLMSIQLLAQKSIRGRVYDAQTRTPLAFANITYEQNKGVVSDFDGQFELMIPKQYRKFRVNYIGYQQQVISIKPQKDYYKIFLKPSAEQLDAVVINGKYVNPAIALMKKAIKLKKQNNYQTKLKKYAFTKYMKFVIGGETDKIDKDFDTIYKNGKFYRLDSTFFHFKKDLSHKYIWLIENIVKVNGKNGQEKAEVIATRTAGLKQPLYELLALQISGQNVYNDRYQFLFSSYIGTFAKSSFKTYRYEIDDTIRWHKRPVIVVNYKNTKKPLISGKIYLDLETLSIAHFTLNTYKDYQFNTVYRFDYYPAEQLWFPKEVTMKIKKAEKKEGINLGGQVQIKSIKRDSIVVDKKGDTLRYTRKKDLLDYVYADYRLHFFDVLLGKNYPDKITYNMQVSPLAAKRSREFWEKMRQETYTPKELRTYQFIDSAAEKDKVEFNIHKYKRLLDGYYPLTGKIDLDLVNLIDYNRYEGLRIKLGGRTNENFSDKWQVSAYGAYGFRDKAFKYSGSLRYKVWHQTQTYLQLSYTDDLQKSAAFKSYFGRNLFNIISHHYADDKFYRHQTANFKVSHLLSPHFKVNLGLSKSYLTTLFPIPFHRGRLEFTEKDYIFYNVGLAFTPFAKYYLAPEGRRLLKDGYPKFYLNFEKNIPQWQTDQTNYYRIDLQTYFKKTFVNRDYTELYVRVGMASQGAGIDKLYMPVTNDYPGANPLKRFNIPETFAFETMKDLEFVDNFITTAHLQHTFTRLKISSKHTMDIRLLAGAAFGLSYNDNKYAGIKSLDSIYYETGIEFRRLFSNIGLGFYYRLGAYAYPEFWDNMSIRLTIDPFNFKLN